MSKHGMNTESEENYIKWIYLLSEKKKDGISTNSLADNLNTKPASVTDMLIKLADKKIVIYEKYKGVQITDFGRKIALDIIRRQRLWKVFLSEKLRFNLDELSEVADQLEHIHSPLLIGRLDRFLGRPRFDTLGDSIPDEEGKLEIKTRKFLYELLPGESGILVSVEDPQPVFLKYLDKCRLTIGCKIRVLERTDFDQSMELQINDKNNITVSHEASLKLILSDGIGESNL